MRSDRVRYASFVGIGALACVAIAACGRTPYHCGPNRECDPGNICTPAHECARPDPACPSGFRESDTASNPDRCIPMLMPADGGDFDSEAPDASELDGSDSARVFVDAAPYDGPAVTGELVIAQWSVSGGSASRSTALASFTTDPAPSCVQVAHDANCALLTCPVNAAGPNDRPMTLADIGTLHTNLPAYPNISYVGGIGYSGSSMSLAFGVRDDVQVWNDGAPGFFAQLVSPAPSRLLTPGPDGNLSRGAPALTVSTEGADLVFVRLEQTFTTGMMGQVLNCLLTQQGGRVEIPSGFLSLPTNFPESSASLTVYSTRRLLLGAGTGRSIALRHFANLPDDTRVDRMHLNLVP